MISPASKGSRTLSLFAHLPHATGAVFAALLTAGCHPHAPAAPHAPSLSSHGPGTLAVIPRLLENTPPGEGMWPWSSLTEMDEAALRARGLEVPLHELWTAGQGGLLQAAVGLGGCSASFVSEEGLLLTNHHCVFGTIQRNSTDDNNLIEKGFVARDRTGELDGKGLRVYVFLRQVDVTDRILSKVPGDASDLERTRHIEQEEKALVAECEQTPNRKCRVTRNNDGLSFVLLENLELRDVRLVVAPPRSLGDFGGEIDNWHWPRHGMDFALIRAYVAPDGSPADHDLQNVPYHPVRIFRVAPGGIAEGDLVMVAGTPGRTYRYRTSAAVEDSLEWYYPLRAELFAEWIRLLEQTCEDVPDSCLPVSATIKALSNSLTSARGMVEGLERNDVLNRKRLEEAQWREWVAGDPQRQEAYGGSLEALSDFLVHDRAYRDQELLTRYLIYGSPALKAAWTITRWAIEAEKPDDAREPGFQERDRQDLVSHLHNAQRSMHPEADRRVFAFFLHRFGGLPLSERIPMIDEALGGDYSPESVARYLDTLYSHTNLFDLEQREGLFGKTKEQLDTTEDSFVRLASGMADYLLEIEARSKARGGALSRLRPTYIASLVEMRGNRFYPDANGTPRVTFGTVIGYSPRDGVWHTPLTSASGILEKQTGEPPFDAPDNVLETIRRKDWGRYAEPQLGEVPLCFLSNSDTTGGNSGSPALNGKGELVGLNFDRVYENIAGDFGYNPEISRNIMVDVRAILWYLDRVVGARSLVGEMGLRSLPGPVQGGVE